MRQAVRALIIQEDRVLVMHRNKFGHHYYTLVGGAVKPGEPLEQALVREIHEETGFTISKPRLVFVQDMPEPYGPQSIYYCETDGREPTLKAGSEEHKINELGMNMHTPVWLSLKDFATIEFRTPELQQAVLLCLEHGFPAQPVQLNREFLEKVRANIQKG